MKNLKKILVILIITLICVSAIYEIFTPKTKTNKDINTEKHEVVFWSLQMGTFQNYMLPLIAEFENQNPDIKIKWIDVPYSEGEKRTLASILSTAPPDLVNLTPDFSSILAQKQALMFIDCSKLSHYNPQIIEMLKHNGKCYAVPFYATSSITFYNKDILKKSGINSIPVTYTEMNSIADKIKDKTNAFVTMPTLTENDTFLKILNKYDINSPEKITSKASVDILNEYKRLYQNDLIPKESITQNHQEALEKYMSGQLAFIQSGANFLNIVKENAPQIYKTTGVSYQPVGSNGKYDVSVMNLIIPVRAKNKEAALKFAIFLTNKQNQINLAKLTTILPVNSEALKDSYFNTYQNDDTISKARCLSAKQLNNLITPVKLEHNKKEIITLLNTSIRQIMLGKETAQKQLEKTKIQWKQLEETK